MPDQGFTKKIHFKFMEEAPSTLQSSKTAEDLVSHVSVRKGVLSECRENVLDFYRCTGPMYSLWTCALWESQKLFSEIKNLNKDLKRKDPLQCCNKLYHSISKFCLKDTAYCSIEEELYA